MYPIFRFELAKMPIKKERNKLLDSLRPVLRRGWDALGTVINNFV